MTKKQKQEVIVEQTSKKYKRMQLLGFLVALLGLGILLAAFESESIFVAGLGQILICVGLVVGFTGGILAWWHHG